MANVRPLKRVEIGRMWVLRGLLWLTLGVLASCSPQDPSSAIDMWPIDVPDLSEQDPDLDVPVGPTIRVATYNAFDFFDTFCDSGRCGADEYEQVLSEAQFDFKARRLAEAIEAFDADIVLLQELEKQRNLDAINENLQESFPYAYVAPTTAGSMNVGVLSRGGFLERREHRDRSIRRPDGTMTTFTREFLEAHFQFGSRRVIVFVAHFKSQRNDDPGRRFAEAERATEIILERAEEFEDALIILGGDLNMPKEQEGLALMIDSGLILLAELEPDPDEYWTYLFRGEETTLDHLLKAPNSEGAYVPSTLTVYRDNSGSWPPSDHAAVSADFRLQRD